VNGREGRAASRFSGQRQRPPGKPGACEFGPRSPDAIGLPDGVSRWPAYKQPNTRISSVSSPRMPPPSRRQRRREDGGVKDGGEKGIAK